eukprot:2170087-Amphidinium_carterae.1
MRAKDIHESRETILRGNAKHQEKIAEVENLKSALADYHRNHSSATTKRIYLFTKGSKLHALLGSSDS